MSFEEAVDCVNKECGEKSKHMERETALSLMRVSGKKQFQQGNGIENQRQDNIKYIRDKGYAFHSEFVIVETADPDEGEVRIDFEEALNYCIDHKKEIDVVIIWKIDRFSRSGPHTYWILKSLLTRHGIRLEASTEAFDDSPTGEFTQSILAAAARFDNRVRTARTIGTEKLLTKQGFWCRPAPTGFANGKKIVSYVDGKPVTKPILVPHSDAKQWELLCYGLKKQMSGIYTQSEVARELTEKGFLMKQMHKDGKIIQNPPSSQSWGKLCRRHVYGGIICNEWTDRKEVRAQFDGPLTAKEWHRLQGTLPKQSEDSPKKRRRKFHPDFPLRNGFLRCPHCEEPARGYPSIGKMKKRYLYYDCPNPKCGFRMDTAEVHKQFIAYLAKVKPTSNLLDLFGSLVVHHWENEYKELNRESIALGEEVLVLKKKKRELIELMKESKDNPSLMKDLKEQYTELDVELTSKTVYRNEKEIEEYEAEVVIAYCEHFIENTSELWDKADVEDQNRLQTLIFPHGIPYDVLENKRTPKTSLVYAVLENLRTSDEILVAPRRIELRFPG